MMLTFVFFRITCVKIGQILSNIEIEWRQNIFILPRKQAIGIAKLSLLTDSSSQKLNVYITGTSKHSQQVLQVHLSKNMSFRIPLEQQNYQTSTREVQYEDLRIPSKISVITVNAE